MNGMNYIGKFISNFRDFYNEINAATLTGAIDVVVVEQPDGSFTCSPFHVRFGKLGVLRSREKIVDIEINGEAQDIHMKLGESGEAFFVEEIFPGEEGDDEEIPPHLACSPIPSYDKFDKWEEEKEKWMEEKEKWMEEKGEKDIETDKQLIKPQVKTFIAETISNNNDTDMERVRKLSTAGGVFKTIDRQETEAAAQDETKPSNTVTVIHSASGGSKRKRKKKKKNNNNVNNDHQKQIEKQDTTETSNDTEDVESESINKLNETQSFHELAKLPLTGETDFHFFSDTEVTIGCSPDSRSNSPVASDTEIEQQRHEDKINDESSIMSPSWKWGELPSPVIRSNPQPIIQTETEQTNTTITQNEKQAKEAKEQDEAHKSMLSGMFSFMKKTKHLRQQDGIYLCDLNSEELDPEVAQLYFPHSYRGQLANARGLEEDAESGNGPSIEHSPISQSPHSLELEWNPVTFKNLDVSMSLCGHLDSGVTNDLFNQFLVSYDDLVANPMLIDNPDLVVRLNGKFYNWRLACPLVMSVAQFNRALPDPVVNILSNELMPSRKTESRSYSSWFYWRRSSGRKSGGEEMKHEPIMEKPLENKVESVEPQIKPIEDKPLEQSIVQEAEDKLMEQKELETKFVSILQDDKPKSDEEGYVGSNSSEESDGGSTNMKAKLPLERRYYQQSDKCKKTLRLTSEQIASLNLLDGTNEVVFSVTTAYQGTTRCKCHIYKWRWNDRIVISDIDGTITKSDVLGHILPIVGKDWAQSGVAQLFTKIKNNGYKLLYLSARAIGQAHVTREYLKSIKQGDLSLPDGPLLLNPTSLINAFHREVIEKKPEEFKISCLRDIAALFPVGCNPFYAGYGNRVNDVYAYRTVGIPIVRIFTINYKGELKHELTQTFQSSRQPASSKPVVVAVVTIPISFLIFFFIIFIYILNRRTT